MAKDEGKSFSDRLTEQSERHPSTEKFQLYRNMYLGGAAACLVLVIQILSVGASTASLKLSLVACSITMPIWLCLAGMLEYYIFLGRKSWGHKRTPFAKSLFMGMLLGGGIPLVVAIGAVLHHVLPLAMWTYILAICVGLGLSLVFHANLANWYYSGKSDAQGQHPEEDPD